MLKMLELINDLLLMVYFTIGFAMGWVSAGPLSRPSLFRMLIFILFPP
uniref:Uncharacterized protein n=1 Tax=uncultured Desulfobacterium sp. TaxID=201089 RepID=E1Y8L5_9BACT|nr:unknown protein [uncultured Desulfobacterium sp.]